MKSVVLLIIMMPFGCAIGWAGNFLRWYLDKRDFRWTWLLCKPWKLTEAENEELVAFYINE